MKAFARLLIHLLFGPALLSPPQPLHSAVRCICSHPAWMHLPGRDSECTECTCSYLEPLTGRWLADDPFAEAA